MSDQNQRVLDLVVDSFIRIFLIGLMVYLCLRIAEPFIMFLLWAVILAVAFYPLFLKLLPVVGGRQKLLSTVLVVLTLALLIAPVIGMSTSVIEFVSEVKEQTDAGTLQIPPPGENVKDWPIIGKSVDKAWTLASENLEEAAVTYREELNRAGQAMVGILGNIGGNLFLFVFATIFTGVFLLFAESGHGFTVKLIDRLSGGMGVAHTTLAIQTIRSVAQGVVGVALLQTILAALGFSMVGIPYVGVWAMVMLVAFIAQIPGLLVMAPAIVWAYSHQDASTATIFMIYSLLVGGSDGLLKPLFLGRGMDIPMPVILVGAIGGMIAFGIVGLFVGAVVLAIAYALFLSWLDHGGVSAEPVASPESESGK